MNALRGMCLGLLVSMLPTAAIAAPPAEPDPATAPAPAPATEPAAIDESAAPAAAIDTSAARERDIAAAVERRLVAADLVWLDIDQGRFPAVFRRTDRPAPLGGVVILNGPGGVVEQPLLLRELAESAIAGGWAALSLQPADIADDATMTTNTSTRLRAGLDFLRTQGLENLIVVADARATPTVFTAIGADSLPPIAGVVGFGNWDASFADTEVAVLAVAGTRDPAAVAALARLRHAARDYPRAFDTIVIEGADRNFSGYEDQTAKAVRGWLERTTPGVAVTR